MLCPLSGAACSVGRNSPTIFILLWRRLLRRPRHSSHYFWLKYLPAVELFRLNLKHGACSSRCCMNRTVSMHWYIRFCMTHCMSARLGGQSGSAVLLHDALVALLLGGLGTSPLGRRRHAGLLGRVLYPCIRASRRCHIRRRYSGAQAAIWGRALTYLHPFGCCMFLFMAFYVSEIDDAIHFRCISYMFPDGSIPARADDHPRGVDFFHDAAPGFLVPAGI